MIIGIDIDDTIVTTTKAALKQHCIDTGEKINIKDIKTYYIEDYVSEEYQEDFYKIFSKKEMWKRIELIPNCVEVIKKLHENHHQIWFCTSCEPINIAKKYNFLCRTFPFINIRKRLITTPYKQLVNFDVLIDDAVHNVVNAPYQSILLSQPWNESFDVSSDENIYRANDWLEIELVIDFIQRRKK